jgi:hypothetical protein
MMAAGSASSHSAAATDRADGVEALGTDLYTEGCTNSLSEEAFMAFKLDDEEEAARTCAAVSSANFRFPHAAGEGCGTSASAPPKYFIGRVIFMVGLLLAA